MVIISALVGALVVLVFCVSIVAAYACGLAEEAHTGGPSVDAIAEPQVTPAGCEWAELPGPR